MVEVKHLVKRYGVKNAVDDISFSIDSGEIVGFLGPVSYTHLFRLELALGTAQMRAEDQPCFVINQIPVSYTHLYDTSRKKKAAHSDGLLLLCNKN